MQFLDGVGDKELVAHQEKSKHQGNGGVIRGWATSAGTKDFFNKKQSISTSSSYSYSPSSDLFWSKIGVGSYLGDASDSEVSQLVEDAVYQSIRYGGINVVDTSINYLGQKAERAIGKALKKLILKEHSVTRSQIMIATKGGFIPADADADTSPKSVLAQWMVEYAAEASNLEAAEETAKKFPVDQIVQQKHCIDPICLSISLKKSMINLGVSTVDLFYLHNIEKQLEEVSREELKKRLLRAFIKLEQMRKKHLIRFYGLATWNLFRVNSNHKLYFSLKEVTEIAEAALIG